MAPVSKSLYLFLHSCYKHECFAVFVYQGVDEVYDAALHEFFNPYHSMVDLMCRVAVNQQILTEPIITFSKNIYHILVVVYMDVILWVAIVYGKHLARCHIL